MSELEYRTEEQRVLDDKENINRPYTKGDPLKPRTESERVYDADRAAQINYQHEYTPLPHPQSQNLVGVHSGDLPEPLALSATVPADKSDRRRSITSEEAADRIRGEFKPVEADVKDARYAKFLTKVAHHLNADPNPANLKQIQDLLGKAEVELPDYDYPKMLYSRTLPDSSYGFQTHIDTRGDHVGVIVNNKEDAGKLGSGFIEKPSELPARKEGEVGKFDGAKKPPAGTTTQPTPVKPVAPVTPKPSVSPAGWDDVSKTTKNSDGTVNIPLTNAERAKRGIVPLNPT
jgi:hypothetical protein